MAKNSTIDIERLMRLEPLSALSNERLDELANLAYIERVSIGVSLFREGDLDNQTLYLLQGDVQLSSSDGSFDEVVTSRHNTAKFPLDDSQPRQVSCVALGLVEFLRIDNSVLDYMMMWDQLAVQEELLGKSETDKLQEKEYAAELSVADTNVDEDDSSNKDTVGKDNDEKETLKVADKTANDNETETVSEPELDNASALDLKAEPKPEPEERSTSEENTAPGKESTTDEISLTENSAPPQGVPASVVLIKETIEDNNSQPAVKVESHNDKDNEVQTEDAIKENALEYNTPKENIAEDNISVEKGAWMRRMRHIMAFKNLPPANIKELLERMESVKVKKGETIVQQGEQGNTFYVLTDGQAKVTRTIELAELQAGASFGEESLVSGGERNASITMKSDGILMKLSKKDFDHLLKEPMLNRISPEDARIRSYKGDLWLDVRHASEYHHSHLRKANNIPLHEIRMRMAELEKPQNYICYCNTGRRSSAAAFILAQAGYKVSVLNGGVRVMPQDLVKG